LGGGGHRGAEISLGAPLAPMEPPLLAADGLNGQRQVSRRPMTDEKGETWSPHVKSEEQARVSGGRLASVSTRYSHPTTVVVLALSVLWFIGPNWFIAACIT